MHRLRFDTARDGSPVPILDDTNVHSAYRPRDEGDKLARHFLGEHPDCAHAVVFGLAFGYHILPLLAQVERITVFEPLPEMLAAARRQPHMEPIFARCSVVSDAAQLPHDQHAVLALPSYRRLLPLEWSTFETALLAPAIPAPEANLKELRVLVDYPIYGGSYTTARYVENALRHLGCQVRRMDNAHADGILQRILAIPQRERSLHMSGQLTELLSGLLWEECMAFRPHLVLFLAQAPISPGILKILREKTAARTAFWFVEDYRRFGYWRSYARLFDGFFGIQTTPLHKQMNALGERHYSYLPMAADPSIHRRLNLTPAEQERYGCDVAFMGAGYPNRHALFSRLADYDLKLWGTGWEGTPALAPFIQDEGARVSPEDTVKIYNAARININLHSSMNAEFFESEPDFVNPRTFEIMACGGFQLVDRRSLLPELFTEDEDIACFGSLAELRQKIDHYLAHPEERERIARNGQRKVLNHHTYADRMRTLVQQMTQWHPQWAAGLQQESRHREEILAAQQDPALERFIASRPPEERDDITALARAIEQHQGPLQNYEAILMALETFHSNE